MQTYIYQVRQNGTEQHMVSFVPQDIGTKQGLTAQTILGILKDPAQPLSPDNFLLNSEFKNFFHTLIEKTMAEDLALQAEASRVKDGIVAVVDQRTEHPAHLETETEDLIGCFVAQHGKITRYAPNPNYVFLTSAGFFDLGDSFRKKFIEEQLLTFGN